MRSDNTGIKIKSSVINLPLEMILKKQTPQHFERQSQEQLAQTGLLGGDSRCPLSLVKQLLSLSSLQCLGHER